jgi:hypothetical protein
VTPIRSEDAFAIWAPDGVLWSEWAKPVAFAQAGAMIVVEPIAEADLPSVPGIFDPRSALIVNLPGADAVYAGLALADRGFRPVPVFNGTSGPAAVLDVTPITRALGSGTQRLERNRIPQDASPAFLLDSRRNTGSSAVKSGAYDNRWVVLPQDFPSGALLASRGIVSVTLVQKDSLTIPPDLAHVLRRWQESGIRIRVVDIASGQTAEDVTVPKPSGFKLAWYAAIALLGLRRSNVGGFGSVIPEATHRSGFYG